MLADILERPVAPVDVAAASAVGAALLAGEVAGIAESRNRAARAPEDAIHPRPEPSRFHRRRYESYREQVAALRFAGRTHDPLSAASPVVPGPGP